MDTPQDPKPAFNAIYEVALEAMKREDLPRGARAAFDLIASLARYQHDVRGRDWQKSVAAD